MMKIYYSQYYQDYILVIGGQSYLFVIHNVGGVEEVFYCPISPNHIKLSRMHKRKEDKEVIFICTVKDN